MRGWLLDTNVVSELRKPKPAAAVAQFVTTQPGELLYITEVTFGAATTHILCCSCGVYFSAAGRNNEA